MGEFLDEVNLLAMKHGLEHRTRHKHKYWDTTKI